MVIGLAMGFFSGLTGIGGGSIIIPGLVLLCGFPQIQAQGISLWAIVPTAFIGAFNYYLHGHLNMAYVFWLAAGSMLGVLFGSTIAHRVPSHWLRKGFGLFIIGIAVKTIFW